MAARNSQAEPAFIEGPGDLNERLEEASEYVRERLGDEAAREFMRQVQSGESVPETGYEEPTQPAYGGEKEHVIDLGGRLRRAWKHWQFRLLLLTLAIAVSAGAANAQADTLARLSGSLGLFLFGAWSVAVFRKRGIGQMFLKWFVYCAALALGAALADSASADNRTLPILGVLAVALVLTLSKLSVWLGGIIRAHVWESPTVRVIRRCF